MFPIQWPKAYIQHRLRPLAIPINRCHYITSPQKNKLLEEKSIKIPKHLHCVIPKKKANLMAPDHLPFSKFHPPKKSKNGSLCRQGRCHISGFLVPKDTNQVTHLRQRRRKFLGAAQQKIHLDISWPGPCLKGVTDVFPG